MSSELAATCDAIVAELEAGNWAAPFTVARAYLHEFGLDSTDFRASVAPATRAGKLTARDYQQTDDQITITLTQRVSSPSNAILDPLVETAEQILDTFGRPRDLTGFSDRFVMGAEADPIFDAGMLFQQNLFVSIITVNVSKTARYALPATSFRLSAVASRIVNLSTPLTVVALDQFGNTAIGYAGTVHFTSSDGAAVLPANMTLTSGTGTFTVVLETAGSQTLTATDTAATAVTGSTSITMLSAQQATHFSVTATLPQPILTQGSTVSYAVQALDASNHSTTGYSGTVKFSTSAAGATLPANSTLTNGAGTFSVLFGTGTTIANDTVTATDKVTTAIAGTSPAILVLQTLIYDSLSRGGGGGLDAHTIAPVNTPATVWANLSNLGFYFGPTLVPYADFPDVTVVDTGTSFGHVLANITFNPDGAQNFDDKLGIVFRQEGEDYWRLTVDSAGVYLDKMLSGVANLVASTSDWTPDPQGTFTLVAEFPSASVVSCYVWDDQDNVLAVLSITDNFNSDKTGAGLVHVSHSGFGSYSYFTAFCVAN